MRGIRLAAVAFAAMLLCMSIYRALSSPPDPPNPPPQATQPAPVPDSGESQSPREASVPVVPPPPSLAAVPKPRRAKARVAAAPPAIAAPYQALPPTEAAVTEPAPAEESLPKQVAETAVDASPEPPIIVKPPDPPQRPNRGVRWMRAVGHALHIGGHKEPAADSLR